MLTLPAGRFYRFGIWPARLVLALLALAMLASIVPAQHAIPVEAPKKAADDSDNMLYQAILVRMRAGEGYYAAATTEQRARGYPTRPFATVRLPTVASLIVTLGTLVAKTLLISIWVGAILAWRAQLLGYFSLRIWALIGGLSLWMSINPITNTHYLSMHELWAGGLLTLSLGLYRSDRWLPSLLIAALALMVREHCLPYVLLMAAYAAWHKLWREAAAWSLLPIGFAMFLAFHIQMVAAYALPSDAASPGWVKFGGLSGALNYLYLGGWFRMFQNIWAYPLIILSLFGWMSWRSDIGLRTSLLLLGYTLMFCLIGRPNTWYWGIMVGPLLGMGMVFLRSTLPELIRAAWPPKLDLATT